MKLSTLVLLYSLITHFAFAQNSEDDYVIIAGSTAMEEVITLTREPFFKATQIEVLRRPISTDKSIKAVAEGITSISIIPRYLTVQEINAWPHLTQVVIAEQAIDSCLIASNYLSCLRSPIVLVLNTNLSQNAKIFVNYMLGDYGQAVLKQNDYFSIEHLAYINF